MARSGQTTCLGGSDAGRSDSAGACKVCLPPPSSWVDESEGPRERKDEGRVTRSSCTEGWGEVGDATRTLVLTAEITLLGQPDMCWRPRHY